MRIVDLNILLYAVNADSPHHARARRWLEHAIGGPEAIALPWVVILGFLRITTSRQVFASPLDPAEAITIVGSWLARPNVVRLDPGDRHWQLLSALLTDVGAAGNLTTDAHLAALAIENGCELCSTDADFARFQQLNWMNPLGSS